MRLEALEGLDELLEGVRHPLAHLLDRLRRPDARDDVLALGVREELAEEPLLSRRRIAREADSRAGALAAVPEDHLHDVDRGPEVVRDLVRPPIDARARRVPGVEHCAVRAPELLARVLREAVAGRLLVDLLERLDEPAQVVCGQVDILRDAPRALEIGERLLEAVSVDAFDHLAVHLDEAPVRIEGEARVAGGLGEPLDRDVGEPEVQDRVHHPRHRDRRAASHRDEQRVVRIAEALTGAFLQPCDVACDLVVEPVGDVAAGRHVRAARIRRDREARRDGDAELRHLGEPDSLPAEELPPASQVLVEVEHVAHLRGGIYPRQAVCG